jgi:hypothetical protein
MKIDMTYFYVCTTDGCIRNKPKYFFVYAETVEARGHTRCEKCDQPMTRRSRSLKGPNAKRVPRIPNSSPPKAGRTKASKKKADTRRKIYRKH